MLPYVSIAAAARNPAMNSSKGGPGSQVFALLFVLFIAYLLMRAFLLTKPSTKKKKIKGMTREEMKARYILIKKEIDEMQHNIDSLEETKNYVLKHKYLSVKKQSDIERCRF